MRLTIDRRQVARLSFRGLAVVSVAGLLGVGGWWALHTSAFAVTKVVATGGRHTSAAAVVAAAGIEGHPSIVDVHPGAVERRIERLPWVATAFVDQKWPHTIVCSITERRAVAVAVTSVRGTGMEVDATGRILGPAVGRTHLPRLVVSAVPKRPGAFLATADRSAFTVLATLPQAFARQVRGVAVGEQGLSLLLPGPVSFLLGDTSNLHAKYVAVATMIEREQFSAGDLVDVTVPDAVVVTHG